MKRAVVLGVVALVVAGCGSDEEEAAPGPGAYGPGSRCQPATTDLMTPLANGMKSEGTRLRNGQIVESPDREGIYFVSAELYGSGIGEPAPVGTWATESTGGAGAIWAVDEVAREYSDLRDGTKVAGLSESDRGVPESRACVRP